MNTKKKLVTILFVTVLATILLKLAPQVVATTENVTVSADAYVRELYPDTNYGTAASLYVFNGDPNDLDYISFLKFSLSSIPVGADITSASVFLYSYTNYIFNYDVAAQFVSDDSWGETAVTWNNKPAGSTTLDTKTVGDIQWYSWTVTSQAETEYNGDKTLSLQFIWTGAYANADFRSREYDSYDAYLEVTYTIVDYAPVNDALTLTNPSIGSQGVLAQKQAYTFRAQVSDPDGTANINYVAMTLDQGGQNLRFRWTEATDTFSEQYDPNGYVSISSTSSDSWTSGNQWTLDFKITFNWNYPDESLHVVRLYSLDDYGLSDTDDYANKYYVENDLVSSGLTVNDYRCDPSATLTMNGYWYYQGTSIFPPDGDYQVKIKLGGVQKGSTDTTLVSGQFYVSDVTAESAVASYSYIVDASYMVSSGSFNTVIVDRLELWSVTFDDSRVNVGATAQVRFNIRYDYDNINFDNGDGSVNIEGGAASYDVPNGWWYRNIVQSASVSSNLYDINDLTFTDSIFGLTAKVGTSSGSVVTDRIEIYYQVLDDSRVNVNINIEFRVRARLDYDDHALGSADGLSANFGSLSWDAGNSWFDGVRSQISVGSYQFQTASGSEATYGITALYIGVSNPTGIWDKLTITITANQTNPPADAWVQFTVSGIYQYDSSSATLTFQVTRNGSNYATSTPFTDGGAGYIDIHYYYTMSSATGTEYGITAFQTNTVTVNWGGIFIEAWQILVDDTRANVASNVYLRYRLRFSNNQSAVGSGTIWVNTLQHSISSGWANFTVTYASVTLITYEETAINVNGETDYGQIPANPQIIWDKLNVIITPSTLSANLGDTVTFTLSATYLYDNQVANAAYYTSRDGLPFSISASFTDVFNVGGSHIYLVMAAYETTYDITTFQTSSITVTWGVKYILYGAYSDNGAFVGAINVTFYREGEAPISFTLNGQYTLTAIERGISFVFDLGYSESRVYYVRASSETIYVFKPSEPYYTYSFSIVDYVGTTNGYLESLLNVNGTDRVVERWKLVVLNNLPFTMSWGKTYKMRLICDQGTYVFGEFVASATTTFTLSVTSAAFPQGLPTTYGISVNVLRRNGTWVQMNYTDSLSKTNWVKIEIRQLGYQSTVIYTLNQTGSTQIVNWYQAEPTKDYLVKVYAGHQDKGTLEWTFPAPKQYTRLNPWDLSFFGTFPFASNQLIGIGIVLFFFAAFSIYNAPLGVLVCVFMAALLVAIGWLDIGWGWMTATFAIALIVAITMYKQRSPQQI